MKTTIEKLLKIIIYLFYICAPCCIVYGIWKENSISILIGIFIYILSYLLSKLLIKTYDDEIKKIKEEIKELTNEINKKEY